jgi:hypothetical protein
MSVLFCAAWFGGCGAAADQHPAEDTEHGAAARLELTAVGSKTNSLYRLGPATFTISGSSDAAGPLVPPLSISADGSQETLKIPLEPGNYEAKLEPGWELKQSSNASSFTNVEATLVSANPQSFHVQYLQTTPLHFGFALGVSGVTIGIGVDEGTQIPAGYDGIIQPTADGRWQIDFGNNSGACCFSSPEEAQAAYPNKRLFVPIQH